MAKSRLTFEEKQWKRGYILAAALARKIGRHHSTIYRWIAQAKIRAERVGDFQWVYLPSVREHLGDTAFKLHNLDKLLARAVQKGIWGTKERSVIKEPNPAGIKAIAQQQFDWGKQVLSHGLVPILEPEVDIKSANKAECEKLLKKELLAGLDALPEGQQVIFKLTIPDVDGFYSDLIKHPKTARVVALSGGYSRDEACAKLAKNPGMIASFSRALTEGLSAQQSDGDFNTQLKSAVDKIYNASIT